MARRRVSPQRAWLADDRSDSFTVSLSGTPVVTTYLELIDFNDLESNESLVARERSEYYFERLIVWFEMPENLPNSASTPNLPMAMAIFTGDEAQFGADPSDLKSVSVLSASVLNEMSRCLQQDVFEQFNAQTLFYDNTLIHVDSSGEPNLSAAGYPIPRTIMKYDLNAKFRLAESDSLWFGLSAEAPFAGDEYSFRVWYKALLRRGR